MTGTAFAAYIRRGTKTNSSTLTDAEIVAIANPIKDDLAAGIAANVDEHYFEIELTRALQAGVRDYTFPSDLLKHIRYAQALLDGTNWTPLTEAELSHIDDKAILTESYIVNLYQSKAPQYYISGLSLKLLTGDAIEEVASGLKLLGEVYPEDITTTNIGASTDLSIPSATNTHRLPRQAHRVWADLIIIEHKNSKDKPVPLTKSELKVQMDFQTGDLDLYTKLTPRNTARSVVASVPTYNDGQDY